MAGKSDSKKRKGLPKRAGKASRKAWSAAYHSAETPWYNKLDRLRARVRRTGLPKYIRDWLSVYDRAPIGVRLNYKGQREVIMQTLAVSQ